MASVASQFIEEVTALVQSDSLEDAREICAEGTFFPNDLHTFELFFLVTTHVNERPGVLLLRHRCKKWGVEYGSNTE